MQRDSLSGQRQLMFRQEEFVKQAVYLQQAFAGQMHAFGVSSQKALIPQNTYRTGKTLLNPYAEFILKVTIADMAQLHLQDQLTDQALFPSKSERAVNRKTAVAQFFGVSFEFMLVLEVSALHMRERSHAQADHVGAGP